MHGQRSCAIDIRREKNGVVETDPHDRLTLHPLPLIVSIYSVD
jgi:hypothetical protein